MEGLQRNDNATQAQLSAQCNGSAQMSTWASYLFRMTKGVALPSGSAPSRRRDTNEY